MHPEHRATALGTHPLKSFELGITEEDMQVKLFEVRDRMTFLPVYAISTSPLNEGQRYLLSRVGFPPGGTEVILSRLNGEAPSSADAYFWDDRTMKTAHLYIREHFYELNDGDVIDVEFILGETTEKKTSESSEPYGL